MQGRELGKLAALDRGSSPTLFQQGQFSKTVALNKSDDLFKASYCHRTIETWVDKTKYLFVHHRKAVLNGVIEGL